MLKHPLFEQAFSKIKDYLPDLEVRSKVEKLLQECAIVTQTELDQQFKQLEAMRAQLKALEKRIEKIEKS